MNPNNLILPCILLLTIKTSCLTIKPPTNHHHHHHHHPTSTYITKSCQTTLYPKLCNKALAVFTRKVKTNPKILAMTALLVTINTTRSTSRNLRKLSRNRGLKRGEKAALIDCVEEVGDSVYELRKSMKELNHSGGGAEFELRMNNVQTWVSAALTDDDTCMDDFTTGGKVKLLVRILVLRIARLTSIALTFVNNYAER